MYPQPPSHSIASPSAVFAQSALDVYKAQAAIPITTAARPLSSAEPPAAALCVAEAEADADDLDALALCDAEAEDADADADREAETDDADAERDSEADAAELWQCQIGF